MANKKRVAMIGLGFGAEFIPIYQRHPNAEVVAVCRRNEKELHEVADKFGIANRFTSYEQVLEDPTVDFVHINSPIPDHAWMSLQALLACSTGAGPDDLALNDVLIKAKVNSRLVSLEVTADGELVTHYDCDGLIFATPTGSTAYNLSAGGPLIHPSAEVIALTPICPHTLSNRSIIFRAGVKLSVRNLNTDSTLLVTVDGQRDYKVSDGQPVSITLATTRLPLVQRRDYAHFSVVRSKLNWNGGVAPRTKA